MTIARWQLLANLLHTSRVFAELDLEVEPTCDAPPTAQGPAPCSGHGSMLDNSTAQVNVRARETMLLLRLPRDAFARGAMQDPPVLMPIAELPPIARVTA